jgi:outer membrane protein OmpA-like peptidoglycan-associated protein
MKGRSKATTADEHWIPLSDLMSGLMMIFMLVAVLFMLEVEDKSKEAQSAAAKLTQQAQQISQQAEQITQLAAKEVELKAVLQTQFQQEFSSDLQRWNAEIDSDLTVRFMDPEILFSTGSAEVGPAFKAILDDFFPRYVQMLRDEKYNNAILEIRIEGHTSSKWDGTSSSTEAYMNNMALSQERTRNVLSHVLYMYWPDSTRNWLVTNLTANGLSSSKPIVNAFGQEDMAKSQRVEFKVRTKNAAAAEF